MKDLIKSWEKLADKYFEQAIEHVYEGVGERLLSAAETYSICADQLRRKLMEAKEVRSTTK